MNTATNKFAFIRPTGDYVIILDDLEFAFQKDQLDEIAELHNDDDFGKVPTGGWYDTGGSIGGVILSDNLNEAKRIEGNINLKSYFNKIYDAIRYGDMKFDKIEIVRVEE